MKRTVTALVVLLIAAVGATSAPRPVNADVDDWQEVVPGEYLVELKADGNPVSVAAALGSQPLQRLAAGSAVYRVLLDPTASPVDTVARLLNTPGVDLAQPNLRLSSTDFLGLRKRFFTDHGPAITVDQARYRIDQPALGNAGLPAGAMATSVRVAVLDTGVDTTHPRLRGRIMAGGYDFIDRDAVPADVGNRIDDNANGAIDEAVGHGTYVAGIVALVAPGAVILPVRVLDSDGRGSTWTMMQGLALAAARQVRVVNLSLGGPGTGAVVERQLERLEQSGVIVVAAAGNDASESPIHPAATASVVGVTAIDGTTGAAATFSNRGSWIDVAAPGVAVVSMAPGGRYAAWGGTSAAAPVVAGVLAVVSAAMPGAAVDDVVAEVTSTARPDGLSGLSAYGRVDARAAVVAART